jgi:hypothetical protein
MIPIVLRSTISIISSILLISDGIAELILAQDALPAESQQVKCLGKSF